MDTTTPQHGRLFGIWWLYIGSVALIVAAFFLPSIISLIAIGAIMLAIPVVIIKSTRRDADEQRAAEETLESLRQAEHSARFLASLIDAADIPILVNDADGRIAHVNRRSKEVLGIGEGMIGRPFDELMTQEPLHQLDALARGNSPGHARLSIPIEGEMHDFDVSADPIEFSHGAVLTFRDITELSRAMTLKADFVANASHELRTPIASIKAAAETLSGPARDDEQMSARLIEMITNNAKRLELLAGDLLDLSKLEAEDQPTQIRRLDLRELIGRVMDEYAPLASRREIKLVMEVDDGVDEILSDTMLLGLILRNLIGNAIKFAHEQTSVRIRAESLDISPDRTSTVPTSLNLAWGVALSVVDKGIGIPLTHQQRVFERFYQVDDARTGSGTKRGTGLGLAIVKHAARRLGGTVKLESIYQSGTTVSIELPRCVDRASD